MSRLSTPVKDLWQHAVLSLRAATNSPTARLIRQILPAPVRSLLHRMSKHVRSQPIHLSLPRTVIPTVPVRVVVFGSFANDWIPRLSDADTWRALSDVKEVLILPGPDCRTIPPPKDPHHRTVLLPLSEDDIIRCPRVFPILAPSPRAVETLRDKAAFALHAEASGLTSVVPTTYRSPDEVEFPCIVKPVRAAFGMGIRILRSREELDFFISTAGWNPLVQICQEFIGGQIEYSTHCVFERGHLVWSCSFAFEPPDGSDIRRGVEFRTIRDFTPPPTFMDVVVQLLAPLDYSGPCNIDYKLPAANRIAIFEVNPRIGGSLMLSRNVPKLQSALRCMIDRAVNSEDVDCGGAGQRADAKESEL